MEEIIKSIIDMPVIIQGALGSALFWLILVTFNYSTKWLFSHAALLSKKTQLDLLEDRRFFYESMIAKDNTQIIFAMIALIFSAIRNFIYGLICLILGFIMNAILPVFLYIGALFGLYFFVVAAMRVADLHSHDFNEVKKKYEELNTQVNELENKLNKSKHRD